jgi:hypothetical protein
MAIGRPGVVLAGYAGSSGMRIELTTPDGRRFEVNPSSISILVEAEPGEWALSVKSLVYTIDGHKQGVRETIEQIKELETKVSASHYLQKPPSPRKK